jgi:hypothetical protein
LRGSELAGAAVWFSFQRDTSDGGRGKWKLQPLEEPKIKERLESLEKIVAVLQEQISKLTKEA